MPIIPRITTSQFLLKKPNAENPEKISAIEITSRKNARRYALRFSAAKGKARQKIPRTTKMIALIIIAFQTPSDGASSKITKESMSSDYLMSR